MKANYDYQKIAASEILDKVLTGKFIAGVVGACPGSGKTTISHIAINDYVRMFPNSRVLVLTHNTNVLKLQYLEDLKDSNVQLNFEFGEFRTDAQVKIGIPASIHLLDWDSIDLLVIDEAHEYWGEEMVTTIYKKLAPKHVILLTGSPSSFIQHNLAVDMTYHSHKKYFIHIIAGNDLAANNVFAPVSLDIVEAFGTARERILKTISYSQERGYDTSKIMIACKTIEEAGIVATTLKYAGRKVSISHSKNDSDNVEFNAFVNGERDVLVVVGKGILGFSDNNLTLVIDFKCSNDLDTRNQLFARALRKHPQGIRKTYLTVPSKSKLPREAEMLKKLVKMMDRKFFGSYIG